MKKILLILALALVCSFNANAQTNEEELSKVLTLKKATAEEAVSKEAAKEVKVVKEKAYAKEAVKEAVAIPSDAVKQKQEEKLDVPEDFKKLISEKREALPAEEVAKKYEAVAVPAEDFPRADVEEKAYAEAADDVKVKAEKICVDCKKQKAVTEKKISASSEPCVTYTAEQALDATVDGNNNTFAAVYSTNATRRCGGNINKVKDAAIDVRTKEMR